MFFSFQAFININFLVRIVCLFPDETGYIFNHQLTSRDVRCAMFNLWPGGGWGGGFEDMRRIGFTLYERNIIDPCLVQYKDSVLLNRVESNIVVRVILGVKLEVDLGETQKKLNSP